MIAENRFIFKFIDARPRKTYTFLAADFIYIEIILTEVIYGKKR